MIECHNIHYSIGPNKLLEDVSWSFSSEQITAVVGPNGAGKSTLLKLLLGIEQPDVGQIRLQGKPLQSWSIKALADVRAYMAQNSTARLALPAFEYLTLARVHKPETTVTRDAFINQVIGMLDIGHLANKSIDSLSGGEFQRVELARAWCQLLGDATIKDTLLVLDEPSSALDIRQTQRLYQHLRQFADSGGTVIVVEHDINQAAHFCDQILMLREGQQIAAGEILRTFTDNNINQCFDVVGRTLVDPDTGATSFLL